MESRLHPWTVISLGVASCIVIFGRNDPYTSALICGVALAWGSWNTRTPALLATVVGFALPVGLSIAIIHIPFGDIQIAPFITSDGARIAGALIIRITAVIAAILACLTAVTIPDLVKAMQGSWLNHKIAYLLGASLQFLPHAREILNNIYQAHELAGVKIRARNVVSLVVIPLFMHLFTAAHHRGVALAVLGVDASGKRTVMRAIPDSFAAQIMRIGVLLAACLVVAL
ncbi:energy-coupling factor transporter transmembrane protein EcfT [Corynebacterium sp. HS2168-gen11]|uniref:energy-coupling factor transporter transmembrane component T family protein n=1 Tax=Corynebacterium sp. HS2168-gen11 TaxID=2974027 RepID=UPI00216AFA6B|nr:energy-coupling factor transporter transmembrane component T [Corynebacterium sp. HS2168-gen11]MCS4534901.1 energy-coupling factor transporter transmembrane protein EcfT [Corynebacterium sp. HS2168-gen11]